MINKNMIHHAINESTHRPFCMFKDLQVERICHFTSLDQLERLIVTPRSHKGTT
ncbi:hypothetical protein glysoja_032846 [Glycine soja]|uniref:Uncharacterized protein n=1 Tax=Glycine soja TaxID=3848 RepID=A0A0B2QXA8_GLYSO|nr:hypothetical protein glysoja_032846 [Glycine soja]